MDKPTSVMLHDAKDEIVRAINEQNIDVCVMKYIVREVYDMVCEAADKEYENAVAEMAANSGQKAAEEGNSEG